MHDRLATVGGRDDGVAVSDVAEFLPDLERVEPVGPAPLLHDHLVAPTSERRSDSGSERVERDTQLGIRMAEAVREVSGPDRDLLIDGHGRVNRQEAIDLARRLEHRRRIPCAAAGCQALVAAGLFASIGLAGGIMVSAALVFLASFLLWWWVEKPALRRDSHYRKHSEERAAECDSTKPSPWMPQEKVSQS